MFTRLRILACRIAALFSRRADDQDFQHELASHLALLTDENVRRGMSPDEAARAARLRLGGSAQLREAHHDLRVLRFVETLWQDIRFAARTLRKSPGFATVAILTLALGIGANTAIFSVLEAQIWNPLPFPDSRHLVFVGRNDLKYPDRAFRVSAADFQDWLPRAQSAFTSVCAFGGSRYGNMRAADTIEEVSASPISATFFETLRMPPAIGRAFLPVEQQPGRNREVILSNPFWRSHFAASPRVIGQTVVFDGSSYTIVGVAPSGLSFEYWGEPDMYVPLLLASKDDPSHAGIGLFIVARQKPGIPLAAAQARMDVIAQQLARAYPREDAGRGIELEGLSQAFDGSHGGLFLFAAAACLVLLIGCANVAGLLLARGLARQHEFAIRAALGAPRAALLRQLLVEGMLLGALGGGLGVLAAVWGANALNALLPGDLLYRQVAPQLDARVLALALAISLSAAILSALAPGLFASRVHLTAALQSGARGISSASAHRHLRNAFVIAEVAAAVALLFGAGLFLNSYIRQAREPLGFDPRHLISLGLTFSDKQYAQPQRVQLAGEQILERVRAVPGIQGAALASQIPFAAGIGVQFTVVGQAAPRVDDRPIALLSVVTPNYFRLLKIPFLRGRSFSDADTQDSPTVAIVTEGFVQRHFGGHNPVGAELDVFDVATVNKRFRVRIVGVIHNTQMFGPIEGPANVIYTAAAQVSLTSFYDSAFLVASTDLPPDAVLGPIRHEIAQVDRGIPVTNVATMQERAARVLRGARQNLTLIGIFAALAVVLVAVGIFGAIAYFVEQRTREFGIRLALGASPAGILRHALKQSAMLGVSGLALGIGLSLVAGRILRTALYLVPGDHAGLLYGVSIFDPLTLVSACAFLVAVLFIASYIPARRAMQVDPVTAMRCE